MSTLHSRIAALIPTITGWCSVERANDLALAVLKSKSSISVEIGVWGGRSCIAMALAHAEQDHGIVWAIDPWSAAASIEGYEKVNADWWGAQDHELVYQNFLVSLRTHGVEKYVKVIRAKSDDAPVPSAIDVLSLDGQHTDQTIRDVERFASKVRPSGFVAVDDISWSGGGVARGVEKLLTMGFVRLFDRDTGAMFQRTAGEPAKKHGRPLGAKNKRKKKRHASK